MAKRFFRPLVLIVATIFSALAASQPKQDKQKVEPLPPACVAEATRIFVQGSAFHDGKHKSGMRIAAGKELTTIRSIGEVRGDLDGRSTLTPASSYALVVVPTSSKTEPEDSCPLHRTYVRFVQGGFNPQPAIYYGPLRAGAA